MLAMKMPEPVLTRAPRRWTREWLGLSVERRRLIEQHQQEAPVRVSRIAAAFDLEMVVAPLPAKISGEIRPVVGNPGRYRITINRFEAENRQRFTAAHELAHYLLHEHQINAGITDTVLYRSQLSNLLEAQANRLAADILMPIELIERYVEDHCSGRFDLVDPAEMAERFSVSEMAMRFRLGI